MKAKISAITYHLPEMMEGNETLQRDNADWDMSKIVGKTGIVSRYISAEGETAVDLAVDAGTKLLHNDSVNPEDINLLILVTQSPDYVLPTSACILHSHSYQASSRPAKWDLGPTEQLLPKLLQQYWRKQEYIVPNPAIGQTYLAHPDSNQRFQ